MGQMKKKNKIDIIGDAVKSFRLLPMVAMLAVITACSTNVTVTGDYPSALTRPLPYHMGLVMDQSFSDYVFKSDDAQDVTMALGKSQSKLFTQVFSDMFTALSTLETIPSSPTQNLDLMVVPHVEEVQLAMPFETSLNVFEVWLKYNVQVFDGKGEPIADWLMSSYGKTQTRFLKSEEDALNQATTSALRDAGARMLLGFKRVPEVRQWLEQQRLAETNSGEGK
jgi:hypothetical protein